MGYVVGWYRKTHNTMVAIEAFKSLHNLIPEGLNSYFKTHQHKIRTRGNGSYVFLPKMRTENGKGRFPTKKHALKLDWKNLFVKKHPSYYSKRNCNYLRLCRFQRKCIGLQLHSYPYTSLFNYFLSIYF